MPLALHFLFNADVSITQLQRSVILLRAIAGCGSRNAASDSSAYEGPGVAMTDYERENGISEAASSENEHPQHQDGAYVGGVSATQLHAIIEGDDASVSSSMSILCSSCCDSATYCGGSSQQRVVPMRDAMVLAERHGFM